MFEWTVNARQPVMAVVNRLERKHTVKFQHLAVFLLVGLCGCQRPAITQRPAIAPGHVFSLRLANNVATPGMTETPIRSTGESIFLDAQDVVAGADFESVRKTLDEKGRPAIALRVNETAGKRMRDVTAENQGKMIAMVVAGVPELVLPVAEPVGHEFWLTGSYTNDEIDRIWSAITGYD